MAMLRLISLLPLLIAIGCGERSLGPGPGSAGSGGTTGAGGATGTGGDAPDAGMILRERCVNGVVDPDEQCDDYNKTLGDGCSALCQWECYSSCGGHCGPPGTCLMSLRCGDGTLYGAEVCDDGNTVGGDGCAASCTAVELGWRCPVPGERCVPICGDGRMVGGETCDDGNTTAGDGCSEICVGEPSAVRCGDGILSGAEECDNGASNGHGTYGVCDTQCRFVGYCGDEVVNGPEECDSGSRANNVTYGNRQGCGPDCKRPHFCGDGIPDTDEGEQCDFGSANGPTDGSRGPLFDVPSSYCTGNCKILI
jgi:cysteine-rich repeat protein